MGAARDHPSPTTSIKYEPTATSATAPCAAPRRADQAAAASATQPNATARKERWIISIPMVRHDGNAVAAGESHVSPIHVPDPIAAINPTVAAIVSTIDRVTRWARGSGRA